MRGRLRQRLPVLGGEVVVVEAVRIARSARADVAARPQDAFARGIGLAVVHVAVAGVVLGDDRAEVVAHVRHRAPVGAVEGALRATVDDVAQVQILGRQARAVGAGVGIGAAAGRAPDVRARIAGAAFLAHVGHCEHAELVVGLVEERHAAALLVLDTGRIEARITGIAERAVLLHRIPGEAQRGPAAERQVQCELAGAMVAVARFDLRVATELLEIRALGDDVERAGQCIAAAQRALWTLVDLDALDVVEHAAEAARPRDVGTVDVRRGARIAQLGVVGRTDAADEDFQVAFLVGHAQARHQGLDVAQFIVDAERARVLGGDRLRGAGVLLQILFAALDRHDDGIQCARGVGLGVGAVLGGGRQGREQQCRCDGAAQGV